MNDALDTFIAVIILGIACIAVWAYANTTVATECEKLGSFYVGTKVYECHLNGPTT